VEVNGDVSTYFYPANETKYGLSILPGSRKTATRIIQYDGHFSCCQCGYTEALKSGAEKICPNCEDSAWVPSVNTPKV
jgi:rubrerythrin